MPRIALYARVSTTDQTLEPQLHALREYTHSRGLEAAEYLDHGVSGAKDRRPALDRLLADAKRRRFDIVAVTKLDRLARSEAGVVWCPRAHRFFGHANHRWREMLARRINVCIGTDSAASTPSLSILDELRQVYQQTPEPQADLILEMGTIRGAIGLGLDHVIGSLRPGKRADFVAVPIEPGGPAEPVSNLLGGRTATVKVWIDGVPVA